ncbi:type II secretion system F family protein [uncultured Thiohalocapsa sp.]|uniref:type II secretion system F family protein n=1 Tax=uncultured Thiohalocapsa sp. TaxID=768990 RepID=UPI0025E84110|nr:type II secretion system F family protein [uncultured Thiohalocapsa sp.]
MSDQEIFLLMVFTLGFLLTQAFITPLMGSGARARRRLRARIRGLSTDTAAAAHVSAVRERYLQKLSPFEQRLAQLPALARLQTLLEQAGSSQPAHRLALLCLGLATAAALFGTALWGLGLGTLLLGAGGAAAPVLLVLQRRAHRLARFEAQLPDALTIAARAMRAGLPFTEALQVVADEMKPPAGTEFGIVFSEINYGGDVRASLLGLLERVPTVAAIAMTASVQVQRETGGNLAELLEKLASVVRERFKFQRSLRTLSASGRLAGWVVSLLPFVMVGIFSLLDPELMPNLTRDAFGRQLILGAFAMQVVGVLWISRIVKIDV